ncbi:hypothetical protein BV20DRAFT_968016 [Pilatotrama ljubarskyi]|nr:hypothetical protein BV20DRAFT_968016 [Pilatotrama ljubarskyi]
MSLFFELMLTSAALLVIFSNRDSVPSAWASTLLTASLVIAAMVQKGNQSITLHHATLTMNFATLSCISSLAVAPTLSIWRLSPENYLTRQLARYVLDTLHEDSTVTQITPGDRIKIERAQSKQRLFLALALLTQVVLQWAWGIVLFVSPVYSQTNCSGDTALLLFMKPFTAREINDRYMVVWVFWLLFSLGITLTMTIMLALTSPARARPASGSNSSRSSSVATSSSRSSSTPRHTLRLGMIHLARAAWQAIPSRRDRGGQVVFWYNIAAVVFWLMYLISAEIQIQTNCIFSGENTISSFGQITALLLAAQPLWSLIAALYRWPARQRRIARRRKHMQTLAQGQPASPPSPLSPGYGVQHTTTPVGTVRAEPYPERGRARSVLVPAERVIPAAGAVVAAPRGDRGVAAPSTGTGASTIRPRAPAGRTLYDIYIPRSSTQEWNELVSLTHLPRSST